MKNIDLTSMQLTPLSDNENKEIDGGSFWSDLKAYQACLVLIADVLILDPLRKLGAGLGKGLAAGVKG